MGLIFYGMRNSSTSSTVLSIPIDYPITIIILNIVLMGIRNFIFEERQKKVTAKINNKQIMYLYISRSSSNFVPISWEKVKPGYIIKIRKGEEFPADCLILDIQGQSG